MGGRVLAAVGDREPDLPNLKPLGLVPGRAAEHHGQFPVCFLAYLGVVPREAAPPLQANGFEYRFLGGPQSGKVGGRVLAALAELQFAFSVHAGKEQLPVTFDQAANLDHLNNGRAQSQNVHAQMQPRRAFQVVPQEQEGRATWSLFPRGARFISVPRA